MRHASIAGLVLFLSAIFFAPLPAAEPALQPGDDRLSQQDAPDKGKIEKDANTVRILFIGDSITLHGTSAAIQKKMGWDHQSGMAASVLEKDYAHLLAAKIQATLPAASKTECRFHTKGGSGKIAQRLSVIAEFEILKPDVVVIQLGEHEKQPEGGAAAVKDGLQKMLRAIKGWKQPPLILVAGVWNPFGKGERSEYSGWAKEVEDNMQAACAAENIPFASVRKYALDPSCSGWGTNTGVQWHPNDKGMEGYAAELFALYQKAAPPSANR